MPRIRPEYKGKYRLEPDEFYAAYYFALRYDRLRAEVEEAKRHGSNVELPKGTLYGQSRKNTSAISKPTERQAIALAQRDLQARAQIGKIEKAAREAAAGAGEAFRKCLLYGVTHKAVTYAWLERHMSIPSGRDMYYDRRRRFYWLLNQMIQ